MSALLNEKSPGIPPVLLREWTTTGPADDPVLANCRPFTPEEADRVANLARLGRVQVLEVRGGLRVTTRSYVGILPLGPVTLHIRPKLAGLNAPAMAALLRYALGLDALDRDPGPADAPMEEAGFADLLALVLLGEVNVLLRAGLLRDYETLSGWRSAPRGKLNITELARHPLRARTTFAVPCRYAERTANNPLNRLLVATLNALRPLVSDNGVTFDLHARAALLEELCTAVSLTEGLWAEAAADLDRRSQHYRPLVEIAALVLAGLGLTVDEAGYLAPLGGFLLDMNRLFEQAVARLLVEYAAPTLRVTAQDQRDTAYRWATNPHNWRRPRLRPDLVITDAVTGAPRLILDTKYKPLGTVRPSPADLYQLTLYSLSFGASGQFVPARIVYPNDSALGVEGCIHNAPRLDFYGMAGQGVQATVDIFGLSVSVLTAALRAGNVMQLRAIADTLLSV